MNTQKETRSPAATGIERARENLYTVDNTTAARKPQHIERLLHRGKENRIATKDLVRISGIINPRSLQAVISKEIANGALILSSPQGGYFLPDSGEKGQREITEYINTLNRRALNTLKTLRTARRALSKHNEQMEIQGWGECV